LSNLITTARTSVKFCLHLSLILSPIADQGGFHGINQECIMKFVLEVLPRQNKNHSKQAFWLVLMMVALSQTSVAQDSSNRRYERQVGASHGAPSGQIRQRIEARIAERRRCPIRNQYDQQAH
jgi:hypothetical protein